MKICFVNPSAGTTAGGSETIIYQFAKHLSENHEVTVLTGKSALKPLLPYTRKAPFDVIAVPFFPRFTPLNAMVNRLVPRSDPFKTECRTFFVNVCTSPKALKAIKEADVISTHYWADSILFSGLAEKLGTASVFHILGGPYAKHFFELDRSTMYVAVSEGTKKLINEAHDIGIEDVVTPGVPSWVFAKHSPKRKGVRSGLLFVGRLQESKGVFELVVIFSRLGRKYRELELVVVGDGDVLDDLKELARKYRLQSRIRFLGSLPYEDVFEHYRSAALFVFPSKSEVFPLVSIEAMSCGLPVAASDIPSLRESTGGNAVLLPPGDIDEWVKSLDGLLADGALRDSMSAKGTEWAKSFTWEKKAQEYEKALHKAVRVFAEARDC